MGLTLTHTTLILLQIYLVLSFNVDTNDRNTFEGTAGGYFGYSISMYKGDSLIVGAPKAENAGKKWGLTHSCDLVVGAKLCEKLEKVDTEPLIANDEIRDGQMMGATVYSDNKYILSCAPRYRTIGKNKKINLHGNCYSVKPLDTHSIWKPCGELFNKVIQIAEARNCQAGFSAKYFSGETKSILAGLPNLQLNYGRIGLGSMLDSKASFSPSNGLGTDSYMGYSVTSGLFTKDKKVVFIGGTPRSNTLKGRVIMYRDEESYPMFSTFIDDPSKPEQTGSYFGASLAAADINGDGLSDLIVGAPFYSDDIVNEGAAYVYLNDKQDNVILTQTLKQAKNKDRKEGGMFATAIGSIGDLNKDGNSDIAIGAPWGGEDGKGIVYLYYGQNDNQEPLKLMQIIRPKDFDATATGFGFSFAEYYPYADPADPLKIENDADLNKYPDLAVGAYVSDQAFVFKSRPVITIIGTLSLGNVERIDLYNQKDLCPLDGKQYKCIKDVEACFQLTNINEGDVSLKLQMDAERESLQRAFVIEGGAQKSVVEKSIKVTGKVCEKFTIFIKNATNDVFRDLVVKLSWDYDSPTNCPKVCPIANKMISTTDRKRVHFVKGCSEDGNDICSTDLVLSVATEFFPIISASSNYLIAGQTTRITMTVTIENKKENAFYNYLYLEYPGKGSLNLINIDDAKVISADYLGTTIWDADSTKEGDKTTLKITLSSPITKNTPEKVQIVMSLNAIPQGTKSLKFKAFVTTDSTETVEGDNMKEIEIAASLVADLSVSSNALPEQLSWIAGMTDSKNPGVPIRFRFLFQNLGPSNADTSKGEIYIPEKFKGQYIFNVLKITLEGSGKDGSYGTCKNGGDLNPLGIDFSKKNVTSRKRRNTEVDLMNCGSPDTTCRLIECTFARLSKSQSLTVTVEATFVDATFEQFIKEPRNISIKSSFTSDAVQKLNNSPDTSYVHFTVNSPYFTKNEGSGTIAWWIILLCILAAILIIGLIVFVMYKKGFFKRKRPEGEEEGALRGGDPEE